MRKLTTTSILHNDELAILANGIRQVVGENVTLAAEAYGIDLEAILRFMPVAEKCRIARARTTAGSRMNVPANIYYGNTHMLFLVAEPPVLREWFFPGSRFRFQLVRLSRSSQTVARN